MNSFTTNFLDKDFEQMIALFRLFGLDVAFSFSLM